MITDNNSANIYKWERVPIPMGINKISEQYLTLDMDVCRVSESVSGCGRVRRR